MTINFADTNQGTRWSIWLNTPQGQRIGIVDKLFSWKVWWVENDIGGFALDFKYDAGSTLPTDALVEFWRSPLSRPPQLIMVGFYKCLELNYEEGKKSSTYYGVCPNDLLNTRIVAYKSASSQARKTGFLDDMMKDVVRENLGTSAGAGRNLSAYGFSVQPNQSLIPSDTMSFAFRNVLYVLQDIAALAKQNGTPVYFRVDPLVLTNSITFEFRTYPTTLGSDRRANTSSPVIFGEDYGNLLTAKYVIDRREERNYVYIGGTGEEDTRYIDEIGDTSRMSESVWNRREIFVDMRNEMSQSARLAKGRSVLADHRPFRRLEAWVCNSELYAFGADWFWGDLVTVKVFDRAFDGRIKAGAIQVREGIEQIDARVEQI